MNPLSHLLPSFVADPVTVVRALLPDDVGELLDRLAGGRDVVRGHIQHTVDQLISGCPVYVRIEFCVGLAMCCAADPHPVYPFDSLVSEIVSIDGLNKDFSRSNIERAALSAYSRAKATMIASQFYGVRLGHIDPYIVVNAAQGVEMGAHAAHQIASEIAYEVFRREPVIWSHGTREDLVFQTFQRHTDIIAQRLEQAHALTRVRPVYEVTDIHPEFSRVVPHLSSVRYEVMTPSGETSFSLRCIPAHSTTEKPAENHWRAPMLPFLGVEIAEFAGQNADPHLIRTMIASLRDILENLRTNDSVINVSMVEGMYGSVLDRSSAQMIGALAAVRARAGNPEEMDQVFGDIAALSVAWATCQRAPEDAWSPLDDILPYLKDPFAIAANQQSLLDLAIRLKDPGLVRRLLTFLESVPDARTRLTDYVSRSLSLAVHSCIPEIIALMMASGRPDDEHIKAYELLHPLIQNPQTDALIRAHAIASRLNALAVSVQHDRADGAASTGRREIL